MKYRSPVLPPAVFRLLCLVPLPLALFSVGGCVGTGSKPRVVTVAPLPHDVPGTTLPAEGIESVRYAENLKAYPINRYVDPSNRGVMHEGHVLYRVETSARWNLRPNRPVPVPRGPAVAAVSNPALHASPLPGELTAELARQKEATRTVIGQGERLSSSINRLQAALDQTAQTAEEQRKLRAELLAAKNRLDQLERERAETVRAENPPTPGPTPPPLPTRAAAGADGTRADSFESPR